MRLSAIGDVCHTLAVVRTLQQAWPTTQFTWIIGKLEAKLLGHLPDIEFIVFDKRAGLKGYLQLRQQLRQRRFDVLLHMQLSIRASAIAALVKATIKLGFDRARARELQWLFTNRRIPAQKNQHVLDGLFGFADYFGIHERLLQWNIPLPPDALDYAQRVIPDNQPTLIISPCSSHVLRNWRAEYYAQVSDFAALHLGMRVLICGGPSAIEKEMSATICQHMQQPVTNLVGKDTLLQLLATLQRASVLLSPDSGPAHMATAVGTPVIGLYATANPARSGPYLSRQWCVDQYPIAAQKFLHKPASLVAWTTKIEYPGAMDLITPDMVIQKLQKLMASKQRYR
ncbi:MAG: glycosyltransferase family 9 protein [Steroidobacteraceae bacterium]